MTEQAPPAPRRNPRQGRSALLVGAIQEACKRILESEGAEHLTTQRIADVAGINIASLYRYFPNKDAVLAEVFEQHIADYLAGARQRIDEIEQLSHESLEQTLAAIIDMQVEQHLALQRMAPDFYRHYRQSMDFHRRTNDLSVSLDNEPWDAWFTRLLARHRERLRPVALAVLSHVARTALDATLVAAVTARPPEIDPQLLKDEILQLLLRYLIAGGDNEQTPESRT